MRWSREEGYYLRERHLERLLASAERFRIAADRRQVEAALDRLAGTLSGPSRVRLLLDRTGGLALESAALEPPGDGRGELRFAFARRHIDSSDPFVYHKTTRRGVLDSERRRLAEETGCDEVLFVNERGELTEGSYTSIFVERGSALLTPPLACGLLDGTLRRELLEGGGREVLEQILYPRDLDAADGVWLGNSVRGLLPARPVAGGVSASNPRQPATAGDGGDRR